MSLVDAAGRLLGPQGRPFTAEQAEAIARRTGPLLLSANAGSGKTSVLVERFVRSVVEDEVPAGAILAITFTDKAAGELRQRVRDRFVELGRRDLAQDAEGAWVSTIHGFCARVLRAHAVAAGLDPAFTVLDEPGARELRDAAFDAALAGLLNGGALPRPAALELVAAWTPDRLERAIAQVHEALRSAGQTEPRLPAKAPPWPAAERDALLAACAAAGRALAGAGEGKTVARARDAVADCAELLGALAEGQDPAVAEALRLAPKAGNTGVLKEDVYQAYLAAHAAYVRAARDHAAGPVLAMLDELLGRFGAAYAAGKRERGAVDYEDLQLLVRDLFRAAPAVAESYRGRFARIMVDEFQDTNRLQLELIELLARDNAFVVGDDLQAIYGFRHATVEVFRAWRARLAPAGATGTLAVNFRSRAEVLEPINALAPLHGEYVPLVAGRADAAAGDGPRVELLLTDVPARDDEACWPEDDALPARHAWRRAEARAIARRVRELVDAKQHRAGDVVVLLRAAGDMATYERALEDAGLATLASGGRGFWARQQVQDLCAYLAALVNPRDERALLGTLASPLGAAASPDALALLALTARAEPRRDLYEVLCHTPVGGWAAALPEAERLRLERFAAAFAAERARAPRLGLDALLERAIARSAYDEHVLRLPGGARRLANVTKLVRLAADFEADRGRDVRGLVDRAMAELEAEAREPDAPVEAEGLDAVRLMTIHAAKGLEFPVVVVADLGRGRPGQSPDVLVDGDRVGIRLVPMHGESATALDFEDLKAERADRERAEERRVMHVAMTRAEERLVLSGGVCTARWPTLSDAAPPLTWLAPALVPGLVERVAAGEHEFVAAGVSVRVLRPDPVPRLFSVTARADERGVAEPAGDPRPAAPDVVSPVGPSPVSRLSYTALSAYAQCPYRFYLERVLSLPRQDPPPAAPREDAPEVVEGLDPLQRGSLVHELLEHLDLEAGEVGEAELRARAAAMELELTEAEVADVRGLVAAALTSDVLARVRAAPRVHREQGFALALGADHHAAPLLNGFVDVLAWEADGGALVVDYKTDRLGGADPEEVTEGGYAIQRRIYALAALRAGASHVEVAHVYLERPAEPAVARYDAAQADAIEAEVAARAAGPLAGEFPVAATPHYDLCSTCPGRGGLCSWPDEMTQRPLAAAG